MHRQCTNAVLVCDSLLWRTRQLLATCLPFPSPSPSLKSTVAQAPPSATPSVFDCFAPVGGLVHLPPMPASHYFTSIRWELGFSETLQTETLSCMPGHGPASDCSPREPPWRTANQETRSRSSSVLLQLFLRGSTVQDNVFQFRGLLRGSSRTRFSQHFYNALTLQSRIEKLRSRE